ncbi:hypothetical protein SCAR479_02102 [Seiridium cardinale]|uniref:Uncharacterized protein n=1 Tax=Seiridium cardinale TaxID=138064 RepID=A0ABR2Y4U4_9PEZI
MLKGLILLLGLASNLVSAAPEYVPLNSDIEGQVVENLIRTGSTSDNACWVKELPSRAPTFQHPRPDVCVAIAAFKQVKIWRTATCSNGTEALLARYDAPGCVGTPTLLETVSDDMIKTCLSMPSRKDGSYAFWCEGAFEEPPANTPSTQPGKPNNGGSIWGLIGILLLIFATMLLIAIIKLGSFISRATQAGNKFLGIFGQKDGAIAL